MKINWAVRALFLYLTALLWGSSAFGQEADIDSVHFLSRLEREVVEEINFARTQPSKYAKFLEALLPYFEAELLKIPDRVPVLTSEGARAVEEAIVFLRSAHPVSPLRPSRGMSLGARDHVKDQSLRGLTGHQGVDGSQPWDRVSRYGKWQKTIGENISYGHDNARDFVRGLIIDDGVADRGHRKSLFNAEFTIVGVACGPHSVYRSMCVITLAGEYEETADR